MVLVKRARAPIRCQYQRVSSWVWVNTYKCRPFGFVRGSFVTTRAVDRAALLTTVIREWQSAASREGLVFA